MSGLIVEIMCARPAAFDKFGDDFPTFNTSIIILVNEGFDDD
jgi:hypothetical protein